MYILTADNYTEFICNLDGVDDNEACIGPDECVYWEDACPESSPADPE